MIYSEKTPEHYKVCMNGKCFGPGHFLKDEPATTWNLYWLMEEQLEDFLDLPLDGWSKVLDPVKMGSAAAARECLEWDDYAELSKLSPLKFMYEATRRDLYSLPYLADNPSVVEVMWQRAEAWEEAHGPKWEGNVAFVKFGGK